MIRKPEILRVDNAEVEIKLPVSGITVTFRNLGRDAVETSTLIEVSRVQPAMRLKQSLLISAQQLQEMREIGRDAILKHREEYAERHARRSQRGFQLSFKF